MIIHCTNCPAKFKFDESKFGSEPRKNFRCPKCKTAFSVANPNLAFEEPQELDQSTLDALAEPPSPTGSFDSLGGKSRKSKPKKEEIAAPPEESDFLVSGSATYEAMQEMMDNSEVSDDEAPGTRHDLRSLSAIQKDAAVDRVPLEDPAVRFTSTFAAVGPAETNPDAVKPSGEDDTGSFQVTNLAVDSLADFATMEDVARSTDGAYALAGDDTGKTRIRPSEMRAMKTPLGSGEGLERPDGRNQSRINSELYDTKTASLKDRPKVKALQEIEFDDKEQGTLELDGERDFGYGTDSSAAARSKVPAFTLREFTRRRGTNVEEKADAQRLFAVAVKSALYVVLLVILMIGGYMGYKRDHFNPMAFAALMDASPAAPEASPVPSEKPKSP